MPKSNFIPAADHDFLVWIEHFIANLTPDHGVADSDLEALKKTASDFHARIAHASDTAAAAKQATVDKKNSRTATESLIRAEARRIKARANYSGGMGAQLGIEGPARNHDLSFSSPDLTGIDQTGGAIALSFTKYKSGGINIYCQRENDSDWVLLGRATVSPFLDNRPLLQTGKPELRRYTAVYMVKDTETGQYSDDLVINCAP
jgi:hypothetical protein